MAGQSGAPLKKRSVKLASAESCTGGWIAQAVTSVSGSSGWFDRGFVTYSNEAKKELLGVRERTLSRHGAVSRETAEEMAAGALARSRAQVSIAVTGGAGPTGGTKAKPVGTVGFAWSRKRGAMGSDTRHFRGGRHRGRRESGGVARKGRLGRREETGWGCLSLAG